VVARELELTAARVQVLDRLGVPPWLERSHLWHGVRAYVAGSRAGTPRCRHRYLGIFAPLGSKPTLDEPMTDRRPEFGHTV